MKRLILALSMLASVPFSRAAEDSFRELFEKGQDALHREDFETAAQSFDKAAAVPAGKGGEPARARLNQGVALYRQNKPAEAAETFARASQTTDPALQNRSLYNAATTRARSGEELGAAGKLPEAIRELEAALPVFRDTLKLNPRDDDARANYEVSLQRLEEFKKKQEEQQQQQDQQKQDQQKQDQQKQDQEKQDQQQQQDQQDQQNKQDQQDQQNKQDQQDQQKQDQQQQQDQQDQSSRQNDQDSQSQEQEQSAREKEAREMTREEAAMLLDALMREEAARRERLRLKFGEPQPVDKDW